MTGLLFAGAAMLLLGLVIALVWLIITIAEESRVAALCLALIAFPLVAGLAFAIGQSISERDSPILAALHKGEWACVSSHSEVLTTYVMSGKVLIPVVTSRKVCDTYSRAQ